MCNSDVRKGGCVVCAGAGSRDASCSAGIHCNLWSAPGMCQVMCGCRRAYSFKEPLEPLLRKLSRLRPRMRLRLGEPSRDEGFGSEKVEGEAVIGGEKFSDSLR